MNPLVQEFLTTLLRKALTIGATWLVAQGWLGAGDAEKYAAGFALLLVSLLWSLWERYKGRVAFLAALAAPAGTPEAAVKAQAKGTPPGLLILVLAIGLACGGATGCATAGSLGLKRVALANEQAALSLQRVQLAADQLEAAGVLTKAQRDSLSPYILRLAQGGQALTRAVAAADVPGTRAQVIGVLGVLSELTLTVDGLPREARVTLIVAIEATRGALLVVSTGV